MIQPTDIHTVTEFRRNPALGSAIAADRRPHVLTEGGRPKLVVQDAATYQALVAALHHAETIARIAAGLESVRAGKSVPADAALAELTARLGIDPNA